MSGTAFCTAPDGALLASPFDAVEQVIHDWLTEPTLTLFCGDWAEGGVMELLPRGQSAYLTPQRYEGRFAGLRDLRLGDQGHHVHLDLGQLRQACYCIVPSVCYDFKPALELRLCASASDPLRSYGLGFAMGHPYRAGRLDEAVAQRYLARLALHLHRYPGQVSLHGDRGQGGAGSTWDALDVLLQHDVALAPVRAHWPVEREAVA